MGMMSEFKEFAVKGNVMDLAVGVIIGGAFGKIVTSFVNDVMMPPIGLLLGGVDFKSIKMVLKPAALDAAGKETVAAVTLNIGNFLQTSIDFIIIAFVIFLMVRTLNKFKKEEAAAPAAPPEPTTEEKLLTEIRDLLKAGR